MAAIQLTRTHRILVGIVVTGAVVIAGIGFAGSYAAVRTLALDKGFGWFANVFPIGVDAGIVVLLALDLLLTWLRIPFPLLRQTAWLLTAATIAFNGAAAWPDPLGVGMHAIIPVLFVVSVEAARHAIGRIADITADKHMESVRITRWLLAPFPTFRLWRRMKLWELRSYEEVIRREQDRLVYRARLRARYGVAWRRRAPIEAIMPLRLARYGVPLSDTAEAGLAAAGIEVQALLPQLEPTAGSPKAVAEVPETAGQAAAPAEAGVQGQAAEGQQAQGAAPAQDQAEAEAQPQALPQAQGVVGGPARRLNGQPNGQLNGQPQPMAADGSQDFARLPGQNGQFPLTADEMYARQQEMQEMYEQYGPGGYEQPWPHDSPWFAAQQQQQQQQYQLYQQQVAQQQVMAPVGPYQERPLGHGALGGVNGDGTAAPQGYDQFAEEVGFAQQAPASQYQQFPQAPQFQGAQQVQQVQQVQPQQVQPQPAPVDEQPPAPAEAQAPAQAQAPEPVQEPEPGPEPQLDMDTYPVGGLQFPEDVSVQDAYFAAYRNYVQEHGSLPNTRQLARFLPTLYAGTPPEERHLVHAIRDLRYRYTSEANSETIP